MNFEKLSIPIKNTRIITDPFFPVEIKCQLQMSINYTFYKMCMFKMKPQKYDCYTEAKNIREDPRVTLIEVHCVQVKVPSVIKATDQ